MSKCKRSSELLWVIGVVFVACGVAICSKADLGVSMIAAPAFIISEAISPLLPLFSVGVTEYVFQGLVLILLCLVVRRFNWRYLLAFAVAVVYGYALDLFLWILRDVTFDDIWLRWIMLIVGDAIVAVGVACYFRTYLPLQVYELFVDEVSARYHLPINRVKSVFDISLLAVSLILTFTLFNDALTFDWSSIAHSSFHSIGLGTMVTTIINSPLIALMGKLIDCFFDPTPRFVTLERILKRH